jgi:hypothetical protein
MTRSLESKEALASIWAFLMSWISEAAAGHFQRPKSGEAGCRGVG